MRHFQLVENNVCLCGQVSLQQFNEVGECSRVNVAGWLGALCLVLGPVRVCSRTRPHAFDPLVYMHPLNTDGSCHAFMLFFV